MGLVADHGDESDIPYEWDLTDEDDWDLTDEEPLEKQRQPAPPPETVEVMGEKWRDRLASLAGRYSILFGLVIAALLAAVLAAVIGLYLGTPGR
jgi:ABC-type microcin C transport system permease subunit YejE